MSSKITALRWGVLVLFCIVIAAFLQSCGFQPQQSYTVCSLYTDLPLAALMNPTNHTVFETPGTIAAIHGSGGATHKANDPTKALKVQQSVPIPAYANQAAVFLNGWKLEYTGDDQHVLAIGGVITEIKVDTAAHTITWDALALLRDNDGEEGYTWLYNFTVVAWNAANLNAVVDQGDWSTSSCKDAAELPDRYFYTSNSGTSYALSSFFSFLQNNIFVGAKSIAVLPRGFGFVWNDSDHHLLQLAYNLDHSEILDQYKKVYYKQGQQITGPVPNAPASHVDSQFVSWNPYTIFKDDGTRRDYTFGEMVSGLGGNDVGVVQPPYSILPTDHCWFCTPVGGSITEEKFVIENIPYQFAIPMLAGWDLEYTDSSDHHVKEIGISLSDWNYDPPANGAGGTLRYTLSSILRDNDSDPPFSHTHKITVLGMRPIAGGDNVKGNVKGGNTGKDEPAGLQNTKQR
jgi:hypothetical protein